MPHGVEGQEVVLPNLELVSDSSKNGLNKNRDINVHFHHLPPPPSFEILFFPPVNMFAGGGGGGEHFWSL